MMNKKIVKLQPNPEGFGLTNDALDPQMFESALPTQHSHMFYENDDIGLYVGLWDTTTMIESADAYPCDEFMVLLDGQAHIKNIDSGEIAEISTNRCFVLPKGYRCQWQQQGYLRKYFLIWQHPELPMPIEPSVSSILLDGASYSDVNHQFTSGNYLIQSADGLLKAHPYHEFIYVKLGNLTIVDANNASLSLRQGDAVFIEQSTLCAAHASNDLQAVFARVAIAK